MTTAPAARRLLLVVDEASQGSAVAALASGADHVDLFPLTGNWIRIGAIERALTAAGRPAQIIRMVEAARLVDDQVTALRNDLPAWCDRVGRATVRGRSVRDWLQPAGAETTAFWFGSIAERNPFKSSELLVAAQVRAIDHQLGAVAYDSIVLSVGRPLLRESIAGVARERRIRCVADASARTGRWRRLRPARPSGRSGAMLFGLAVLARQLVWAWIARGLTLKVTSDDAGRQPLLFVTYYPYLDRTAAAAGRFRNRFAGPLQDALEAGGRQIWWAALFVFIDGWRFRDAVALARTMANNGERLCLIDAYLTPRAAWRVLRTAAAIAWRAVRIERDLSDVLWRGFVPQGAAAVGRELWRRSFMGADLVRGLTYVEMFRGLLRDAAAAETCLYFVEFQAWEQALNVAAAAVHPRLQTIGFQHTSVSRNHYFYFRTRDEMTNAGRPDGMRLPSIVAASGRTPGELLAESGLPRVTVVESIRQLHLADVVVGTRPPRGRDAVTLLVAGSIDYEETRALVSLVATALPSTGDLAIHFKAHPSQPFEPIFAELGVDAAAAGYRVVGGMVGDSLARSALVLVGSSAIAVEALAYGCDVLVPVLASVPCLTPLTGFDAYCTRVFSPADLRAAVSAYRAFGPSCTSEEKQEFARRYWTLDRGLPAWRRLLALPQAPAADVTLAAGGAR